MRSGESGPSGTERRETRSGSRLRPLRSLLASPWTYRVAGILLGLIGLYSLLMALQLVGIATLQPYLLRAEASWVHGRVQVTGRTLPFSVVEIWGPDRSSSRVLASPTGAFNQVVDVPRTAPGLQATARTFTTGRAFAGAAIPLEPAKPVAVPQRPLVVALAYHVGEIGGLWVAGYATPEDELSVEGVDGRALARARVDEQGLFDAFVSQAVVPEQLRIRSASRSAVSESVTVARVGLDGLPLARETSVRLEARGTTVTWRITLPAVHPYFRELAGGRLTPREFVSLTSGYGPPALSPGPPQLRIDGAAGTVTLVQSLAFPLGGIEVRPSRVGIASRPLLSARDCVLVTAGDDATLTFDEPLPTGLEPGRALWRGPVAPSPSGRLVSMRRGGSEGLDPRRADRPRAEEQPRDYLRSFEQRTAGEFGFATWRFLLGLIPLAGFLWLWKRGDPIGPPETWRAFAGVSLLIAIWRSWSYVEWLMAQGPARWVKLGVGPVFAALNGPLPSELGGSLRSSDTNAAWLVFLLVLPLVTLHLAGFATSFVPSAPPGGRWSRLGTQARRAHRLYAAAVVALLLAMGNFGFMPWLLDVATGDDFRVPADLVLLAAGVPLLLTLGLRAGLFGAAVLFLALDRTPAPSLPEWLDVRSALAAVRTLPDWLPITIVVLTAYLLLLRLVRPLAPGDRPWRRLVLAAATMIAILIPYLSPEGLLVGAGALVFFTAGWLVIRGLGDQTRLARWAHERPWRLGLLLTATSFVIAWPVVGPGGELRFADVGRLVSAVGEILVFVPAAGVVVLLLDLARREPGPVPDRRTVTVGIFLFAVFLINSSATWLFVPLPLILGWLAARFWLFQGPDDGAAFAVGGVPAAGERPLLVRAFLEASAAGDQLEATEQALRKQLEAAQLSPEAYTEKLGAYRRFFASRMASGDERVSGALREAVFGRGGGSVAGDVSRAVGLGAVLASGPFLIALYQQYAPGGRVPYPYPAAELVKFLVQAAASWLLYAFFFGYFFTYLRGSTGLAKGINFFLALTIPLAIWRLLSVHSLHDLRPFLLWASQLFLFCSLLGLIAFDYWTLRRHGRRARDLTTVHNIPALSVYGSSLVAAVVPAVIALFTGRVKDLVQFFLTELLPRVPTTGP